MDWCVQNGKLLVGSISDIYKYQYISKQTEWWLLNHVLQKTTVVFSESKLITHFHASTFTANCK